jgi:hypothetical protein
MSSSCNKNIVSLSLHDNNHDDILISLNSGLIHISKEQTIPLVVNDVLVIIWPEVQTVHYASISETAKTVDIHHSLENLAHVMTTISDESIVSSFMSESQ